MLIPTDPGAPKASFLMKKHDVGHPLGIDFSICSKTCKSIDLIMKNNTCGMFFASRNNPPPRLREWRAKGVFVFGRCVVFAHYFSTFLLSYFSTFIPSPRSVASQCAHRRRAPPPNPPKPTPKTHFPRLRKASAPLRRFGWVPAKAKALLPRPPRRARRARR